MKISAQKIAEEPRSEIASETVVTQRETHVANAMHEAINDLKTSGEDRTAVGHVELASKAWRSPGCQ
jgi:hypothetical protein